MSDFWEHAVNLYHMRLVPTVKRMLDRRRFLYTLLTVGVLILAVTVLSLLVCHTADVLDSFSRLEADYQEYLTRLIEGGGKKSPMPEMSQLLELARGQRLTTAALCGVLWLVLAVLALGRIMTSVMESEAYVYGLFMIYGADRKQLSRQLSVEFLLAGVPSLAVGLPLGYGIYRIIGGEAAFPFRSLWFTVPCFLLLILICSSVLAKRLLGLPCIRLLNAADTAGDTVSPRRSHLAGLTGKRGAMRSAALAMWRMRRHYVSLAVLDLLIVTLIFGILTPGQTVHSHTGPAYTVEFPFGMSRGGLEQTFISPLEPMPGVSSLQYKASATADQLGIHVLTDSELPDSLSLEERYATQSFRIACGDGDTFYELGGNLTIPEEFHHMVLPDPSDYGYRLEGVPEGCAVYVYPAGSTPPLSLQAGDTVRLYLPHDEPPFHDGDEAADEQNDYLTVRIISLVAVNSLYAPKGGPELCPRITEDYLYLSPPDFQKFDGETHATGFTAEEAFPSDLALEEEGDSCVLVVPYGYWNQTEPPDTVTVIAPESPVKEAFRDSSNKESLPDDTYFINHTAEGMSVYFGTEQDFAEDYDAAEAVSRHMKKGLGRYVGAIMPATVTRAYRVQQIIYTEGGMPYLILPRGEEIYYSDLQNELCAFRLNKLSGKAVSIGEEAYLVESDTLLGPSYFGKACYLGTTLIPDFLTAMERNGLRIQFTEAYFNHTKTVIRNSFKVGEKAFLFAEPYPFFTEVLQSDFYPRLVSRKGSFILVGDTGKITIQDAADEGIWGYFETNSIGSLREQSTVIPGQYASNSLTVCPAGESGDVSLRPGQGIFVTSGKAEDCAVRVGDILSVATRADTSELESSPAFMSLAGNPKGILAYLLENTLFDYTEITVTEIREGEQDALILTDENFSLALDMEGVYSRMNVELSSDIGMAAYLDLHKTLTEAIKKSGGRAVLHFDEQFMPDRAASGSVSARVPRMMGYLAACILPLLLLAAQLVFMEKRREESEILFAIGLTPRRRRRQFTSETGLWALLMAACTAVACPVGYFLARLLGDTVGAEVSGMVFDLSLLVVLVPTVFLSCLAAGFIAYARVRIRHRRRKGTHAPSVHPKANQEVDT